MAQRALVNFSEFAFDPAGPGSTPAGDFSVDGPIDYVDTSNNSHTRIVFIINVSASASAREIENAAVAEAIAQQPTGFSLTDKDIVVVKLQ